MGAKRQKRGGDQRSEQLKSVGKNRMNLGIVQVVRDKRQACYRRQFLQEIRISGQIDKQCVSSLNDSEVPEEIEDLMSLPGVGRKTANVVASIVYDKPVIAVDTHVFRVSHRIGLSSGKTPFAVECDLEKNIPPQDRGRAHHWLILHGRYVCKALKPQCRDCGIKNYCKDYERRVWNDNPDR